jgi:hypothetical protein
MVNTVVEVEMQHIIEAYESRLCSGPETVAAESRLCSGPETVAAAVVNTVVEVEDPKAQITDLNISSLKESPDITAQSLF